MNIIIEEAQKIPNQETAIQKPWITPTLTALVDGENIHGGGGGDGENSGLWEAS